MSRKCIRTLATVFLTAHKVSLFAFNLAPERTLFSAPFRSDGLNIGAINFFADFHFLPSDSEIKSLAVVFHN